MQSEGCTKFTFPKSEKLTGKKNIEELFKARSSFFDHPILVKYLQVEGPAHRALFAVSKKSLKKAVDRNLIKRRMREAYRLNKHLLLKRDSFFNLAFIYTDPKILSYKEIESKLSRLLHRLEDLELRIK